MRSIIVSAPGKLHLSGEHAVVYGKPAVLAATDRRMFVTIKSQFYSSREAEGRIEKLSNNSSRLARARSNNNISKIRKSDKYIDHICKVFENKYQIVIGHLSLDIRSDIPESRGMGSSAALAVALIAALTKWYSKPWNITQINELAFQAEKFVHANSSGGDVSIVCHGGILWYRKEFDFLKTFWALPFSFPQKLNRFVLIDTGRTESTGEMVNLVSSTLRLRSGQEFNVVFQEIEETTKKMVLAIKTANEQLFKNSIRQNETLLEQLGVVSVKVKKLIREIENKGGAAKISGAGGVKNGSGIVIGFNKYPKKLIVLARKYNYPYFQVKLGEEGVRIEKEIH